MPSGPGAGPYTDFVGTVREALEEAADCPVGNPWYRAAVDDGTVVGFDMQSWNVEPSLDV